MNCSTARELINNDLTLETRLSITSSIKRAYDYLRSLQHDLEFLQIISSKNHMPRLLNLVVDFMLKKDIDKGLIPLKYQFSDNASRNHKHIELVTTNAIITISKSNSKNTLPRDAWFRKDLGSSNLVPLANFPKEFLVLPNVRKPYYILITHGHFELMLDFISLGVPDVVRKIWITKIDLLNEYSSYVRNSWIDDAGQEQERLVNLKNELKEALENEA